MTTHRLADAIAALDGLRREQLDWLEIHDEDKPRVTCHPHPYAGAAYGGPLAAEPDLATQVEQLRASGLVGTVTRDGSHVRLWDTPAERARWETRVRLAASQPAVAELVRKGAELKVAQWRRDEAMQAVHEAIWAADVTTAGSVKATDLIDASAVSRKSYYGFVADRPEGYTPPSFAQPEQETEQETEQGAEPAEDSTTTAPDQGAAGQGAGGHTAAPEAQAAEAPARRRATATSKPTKTSGKAKVVVTAKGKEIQPMTRAERRAAFHGELEVGDQEIADALAWAKSVQRDWSRGRAAEAVERFQTVTQIHWAGTHVVINAILEGYLQWNQAKAPAEADLGLYHEMKERGHLVWKAHDAILMPGAPSEDHTILGCDVNSQYVAAAVSAVLGDGELLHYQVGEQLPEKVTKLAGWVRLGAGVPDAPHGLQLPNDMWVPCPIAEYLVRDHGLQLDIVEAKIWEKKHSRPAMKAVAQQLSGWTKTLKSGTSQADADALAMLKSVYTKMLGGYLMGKSELTTSKWRRPDWENLIVATAEANFLRGLDKLPAGIVARAKFRDAVYLELAEGADISAWGNLDPIQPGKFKIMGERLPAGWFADCTTPEDWRKTYAMGE